jgi:hypothetical protein
MTRLLALLGTLLVTVSAAAETGGMWGSRGISRDFLVSGDLLFNADGRGVSVYRVGTALTRTDVELSDHETNALSLIDDQLFVATNGGVLRYRVTADGALTYVDEAEESAGITEVAAGTRWLATATDKVITLRERSDLSVAGKLTFSGRILSLVFVESILYAAIDQEGVRAIDPEGDVVATLAVSARDLALQGRTLYAATGPSGVTAIDVTSPALPTVSGNGGGGEVNMTEVAVAGTRAFAIQPPDKLYAFDVAGGVRLMQTITEPVSVVAASGNRLFVAGSMRDMYGLESATGVPVRVLDAQSLQKTTEFRDLAGPVSGVDTDGSVAYVVDPPYFRILDISKTASPREIAKLEVPRIQDRVRVKRGLAIVYGRGLVNLIDVRDPYKPKYLGTYDSLGTPPSNAALAFDTFIEANYASGLHVVDYSDAANPVQISGRIWHYLDLVASDDVIYAILQNAVLVADLTNRRAVVDVMEHSLGAEEVALAPAAAARPNFLLVRTPTHIHVFDLVEDRFRPREVAAIPAAGAGIMGTTDGSVYFRMGGALWEIDLHAPGAAVNSERRVTAPMQIAGSGEKLVVADRYSVRVFGPDTTAPPQPPVHRRRSVRK